MTIPALPVQTPAECRWSRPGYRIHGVEEHLQPETPWVCVRRGDRRDLTDETCRECIHWQARAEPTH